MKLGIAAAGHKPATGVNISESRIPLGHDKQDEADVGDASWRLPPPAATSIYPRSIR